MSSRSADGGRDDWQTPEVVLRRVRQAGLIGLDPCTAPSNPVGARRFFTEQDDAFAQDDWPEILAPGEVAYCNPPYADMESTRAKPGWAGLIMHQAAEGAEVISLVAARVESGWFKSVGWDSAAAICFWRGRIRFIDAATGQPAMAWSKKEGIWKPASAGFPSAVLYHGPRPWAFEAAFHGAGKVVRL